MSATVNRSVVDDYTRFCAGVRALTAIDLSQYKREQMERRIRSFAQRRGVEDLDAYLARLRHDHAELEELLDRVTINVSQLWRNPEQWRVLEREVLPQLLERVAASTPATPLRAWSAGCSYGAESYTLAALVRQLTPSSVRVPAEIVGTDIDRRMVERARRGRFSDADARSAAPELLRRWFTREGAEWQASPPLRELTRFEVGDLLRMSTPRASYDLILCRNTVIYFTEQVRDALHERLAAALRPGGCLVIGSTERVSRPRELGLSPTHPFTYRKH